MSRGKKAPDEIRAGVLAAIASGRGVREAARQYGVDPATVTRWRDDAGLATAVATGLQHDGRPERTGSIDGEVRMLAEEMIYGTRILVAHLTRQENLDEASYGDVVGGLGTLAERVGRILEAAITLRQDAPALPPGEGEQQ